MDYDALLKSSLLLPKTDFPMRADLPKREPTILDRWQKGKIYGQIIAARQNASKKRETTFILHDGPPFANGNAHMGHALNIVLKDIILKYHNMSGHYTPFIPGWDCHGLPIEHKVMKDLGKDAAPGGLTELDPLQIRAKCEASARSFVAIQSGQFQRLGVFGDWEKPYLTLEPAYEAATLRVFAKLVGKGLVFQGLRPVHWSTGCQTALAEAEIEYAEKVDPAAYVEFPLNPVTSTDERLQALNGASLLIWTTTPWTLPANLAIAVNPKLNYTVLERQRDAGPNERDAGPHRLIVAEALVESVLAKNPAGADFKPLSHLFKGEDLVGLTYTHPFLDDKKSRAIYPGDFVSAEAGTGLVHIAPGHGQDDYILGQANHLPVFAPVDDRGCLTAECGVPELVGKYVFKANPLIVEMLKTRDRLWAVEDYRHDYPHCWRSKTPIVFRAVKQWFIQIDPFRQQALDLIDQVKWLPASGYFRMRAGVEGRPDWCISRQRTWGIPLPIFFGEGGQPMFSEAVINRFADMVEKDPRGGGIWFAMSADELAETLQIPKGLQKGKDTLDVWIDSGTSHAAVLRQRPEFEGYFPADLYLEGSDQHRGWFHSSLLTSVAFSGEAPYKAVYTNGFVVNKMSGNKLAKQDGAKSLSDLVNEHGADVLRLWVTSQSAQEDVPYAEDIFARVSDTYRSIRNTIRVLLGNLADFNPAQHAVSSDNLGEFDSLIYFRYLGLVNAVKTAYADYDFPQVYQLINRFCGVDLSSLYVDVLKDRLYCDAANSPSRRSAQTVMHEILGGLLRMLAPLIPYTAEEAWDFYQRDAGPSVRDAGPSVRDAGPNTSIHLELLPSHQVSPNNVALKPFIDLWKELLELRSRVNEKLEQARQSKLIGKSLEAAVTITSPLFQKHKVSRAVLEEVFIVSKVNAIPGAEESITVEPASTAGLLKCVRCWKYHDDLGKNPAHKELCIRCTSVVEAIEPK